MPNFHDIFYGNHHKVVEISIACNISEYEFEAAFLRWSAGRTEPIAQLIAECADRVQNMQLLPWEEEPVHAKR